MRRWIAAAAAGLSLVAAVAQAQDKPAASWTTPSDADIRQMLVQRIDVERQGVGIVVGVIDVHGRRIVSYGALDKGDPRPLDGKTLFEIGSMTKVFTSLLLAEMVQRGEVRLDDPAARYLPPTARLPQRNGRQITLIDLATHTSGLPRLPDNLKPKDPLNPYADYTVEQLYAFLASYQLPRDIGSQYEYSNLGGGLLGHVLTLRAGTDYATLVRQRITGPLHMDSTVIAMSQELKRRLAVGHTENLEPTSGWDIPTLAGAGALRSDAEDILTFLAAELGYQTTPLAAAMKAQTQPRRPTPIPNTQVALGWHVTSGPGGAVVWHNGGTGGYRTFMGFDPAARVGVVVLSNLSNAAGGDDIGMRVLTGSPLAVLAPRVQHTAVAVDPKLLQGLVGRYQVIPQVIVEVTLEGGRLYAQLTGQARYEVFPEGPDRVFWKVVEAWAEFQRAPDGRATGLVLHQNGRELPAVRIAEP